MSKLSRLPLLNLALILVAITGLAGYGYLRYFRPDVERLGGTMLTCEMDEKAEASSTNAKDLADTLARRIEWNGMNAVTVRPVSERRIEISILYRDDQEERIRRIKTPIAQPPQLDFRILANPVDDEKGIEAARKYLADAARDEQLSKEVENRARRGESPPGPPGEDGFASPLGRFTYSWLAVGAIERRVLGLGGDAEEDIAAFTWQPVAEDRAKGEISSGLFLNSFLLYRRPIQKEPSQAGVSRPEFDYFLLSRDPERDARTGASKAITGADLKIVHASRDDRGHPSLHLLLNARGSELFGQLTTQNKTEKNIPRRRYMAVVLDGRILIASVFDSVIREGIEIRGVFTGQEVSDMARLLRAGSSSTGLNSTALVQ